MLIYYTTLYNNVSNILGCYNMSVGIGFLFSCLAVGLQSLADKKRLAFLYWIASLIFCMVAAAVLIIYPAYSSSSCFLYL